MNERDFIYWLNGFFEMASPRSLDEKQTEMIRQHLALVFTNVTALASKPSVEYVESERHADIKEALKEFHRGPSISYCGHGGGGRIC